MLKELDRLRLASTFASDRFKKFHPWQQFQLDYVSNLDHE